MRSSLVCSLIGLAVLAGCRTTAEPPTSVAPNKMQERSTPAIPANYRVLTGQLIGIPAGAEVELALVELNERSRPARSLGDTQISIQTAETPFQLAFDPERFPTDRRVELRGRVIQSGQLTMRLPSRSISLASDLSVGSLQAIPTP